MGVTSASTPPAAALVLDAIARIEERRDTLDRLADKGMEMVERLVSGETVEIAGRKSFADPARAFAVISRAVRLCLALASRLDEELIAMLRGGPIPNLAILTPKKPLAQKAHLAEAVSEVPAPVSDPRARIVRAVDAAIEAEAGDCESAERMRVYVQEYLVESEDYDALLHQPWRVVVQTICSDLGIRPDWGEWDKAEGFKFEADDPAGDGQGASTHPPTTYAPPIQKPLIPAKVGTQIIDPARGR